MNKKIDGFSAIELILIITVITLVGSLGWYVSHKNNPVPKKQTLITNKTDTTSKPTSTITAKSDIELIMQNVDYELLDSTSGGTCWGKKYCYFGKVYFLKLKYPATPTVKNIVNNLDKNKWLAYDSKPLGSTLNEYTTNLLNNPPKNDNNLYSYLGITNSIDDHLTAYRGDMGIYLYPFIKDSQESSQDTIYNLNSEISINDHNYDYGSLLSKIDDNSYILSITLGKKSDS